MTTVGFWMMICSNILVISLCVYCFVRTMMTPGSEQREHAPLGIDTRDADPPFRD